MREARSAHQVQELVSPRVHFVPRKEHGGRRFERGRRRFGRARPAAPLPRGAQRGLRRRGRRERRRCSTAQANPVEAQGRTSPARLHRLHAGGVCSPRHQVGPRAEGRQGAAWRSCALSWWRSPSVRRSEKIARSRFWDVANKKDIDSPKSTDFLRQTPKQQKQ
ncbi:hypothetical protein M885DRAFT_133281 [Pelagophyceae sp. CCMP2097]|nr:hypothetical protein M885DRAFT_133281 [Pelagophyceae sp. CCMP2097]